MSKEVKNIKAAEAALGIAALGAETKAQAQLRGVWERRLAPLGLALGEETPPDDMWYRIRSTLDRTEDRTTVAKTKRGIWRWRWLSLLLGLIAAALAAFILMKGVGSNGTSDAESSATEASAAQLADSAAAGDLAVAETSAGQFVAVATPDGSKQALILELDPESGTARIRPVGVTVTEGQVLEMWRVTLNDPPVSLGLIEPDEETTLELRLDAGNTILISQEPEGGSTTGAPSGPTVFSAPLIQIP